MIFDEIGNRHLYDTGTAWRVAFDFIVRLGPDCEENRYDLMGRDMYATVESYTTRLPQNAFPEAHRAYVDIQVLLSGREQICLWPTSLLRVHTAYSADRDIEFYEHPDDVDASLVLSPGRFAVFHPGDAHMPGLQTAPGPARVKKVVVKVATRIFQSERHISNPVSHADLH